MVGVTIKPFVMVTVGFDQAIQGCEGVKTAVIGQTTGGVVERSTSV
jgi:hypothetical protein